MTTQTYPRAAVSNKMPDLDRTDVEIYPRATAAPTIMAAGAWAGVFSNANHWKCTSAQVGPDFTPGTTLIILLYVDNHTGTQVVWCYNGGTTTGWRMQHAAGGTLNVLFGATSFQSPTDMKLGLNAYAVQRLQSGALRASLVGGTVAQLSAAPSYTTANASAVHGYGARVDIAATNAAAGTRILAVAILRRASGDYTDAELQKFSGSLNNLNSWQLHPDILADANLLHAQRFEDWDGSSNTFTALGSAPYTLTKQGTGGGKTTLPSFLRYEIPRTAVHDSVRWEAPGNSEPSGTKRMNIYGRVRFTSSAAAASGVPGLFVEAVKSIDVGATEQKDIGVLVDGAQVAANEENALEIQDDNITRLLTVTGVGVGSNKAFTVISGAQRWPGDYSDAYPIKCITPVAVRVPSTTPLTWTSRSEPAHRLIIVSDNHAVELEDSAANITSACYQSWPMLVRANSTYGVTVDAWEGRSWFTASLDRFPDESPGHTAIMSTMAMIIAAADGTSSNTLWIDLGVTDYNHDLMDNEAEFKNDVENFLDALHAALPNLIIYVVTGVPSAFGAANNTKGWNMTDETTWLDDICAARAWTTRVNARGYVTGAGIGASGNYYTVAGHAQYEAAMRLVLGY